MQTVCFSCTSFDGDSKTVAASAGLTNLRWTFHSTNLIILSDFLLAVDNAAVNAEYTSVVSVDVKHRVYLLTYWISPVCNYFTMTSRTKISDSLAAGNSKML